MKLAKFSFTLFALLLGGSLAANAQMIGVQFWTQAQQPDDAALGSNQTAGVVPQDYFNAIDLDNLTANAGTFSLADSNGAPSGVTLAIANNSDSYYTGTSTSTPNGTLLSGQGGLFLSGSATYTFTGLAPGTYDLIAYSVTNTTGQNAEFSLTTGTTSGPSNLYDIEQNGSDFTGAFIQGSATTEGAATTANYVEFTDVSPVGNTIEITMPRLGGSAQYYTDAVNGFQLVAVPEPPALVLTGIGTMLLLGLALRRRLTLR